MSFYKDPTKDQEEKPKFEPYAKGRKEREREMHMKYFMALSEFQAINVGGRSPLMPATADQAFFYPVKYPRW